MRRQAPIAADSDSERARDERWLAGRLALPFRRPDDCARAAAAIEHLLATRGLTADSRIPAGLLARVRAGQTPLVHHVLALSEVTRLGLYASLRLVGYDLEDLPLLQAVVHRDRTVVLPSTTYDPAKRVTWPEAFDERASLARGEFLSEVASRFNSLSVADIDGAATTRLMSVRVGRFDTGLVPTLVPGTIVQVNTTDREPVRFTLRGARHAHRPVYAVAHVRGLSCAYVDRIDDRRIALVSTDHRRQPLIYRLEDEAIVLGRVCGELRPMNVEAECASQNGHDRCASRVVLPDSERQTFGAFLRAARETIGMTHRDAHAVSVRIADAYGDPRFAIGVGTLSDWESQPGPPLHVPHLISLAACYAVSFTDLMRASGVSPFFKCEPGPGDLLAPMDAGLAAFPPALLHAVRIAADLPDLAWDDVFRCGDDGPAFDRVMVGVRYVIVNRRHRRIALDESPSNIDRPLYIISDECGRQICAGCFADGRQLYIQPDPHLPLSVRAVPRDCVTIRGRVAAILRQR